MQLCTEMPPVSQQQYIEAQRALHSIEDVRQLAASQRALTYDALLSMFASKQQDHVKKNSKRHRQAASKYVERYERGETMLQIAASLQLPPSMLARIVLEDKLKVGQGKEVGAFIKDPSQLPDKRLQREVREAVAADVCYGPGVDTVRRLIGVEYEMRLEQHLRDLGVPYKSEAELRQQGDAKTPDALLPVPLLVGNRRVHWIDSKATFGDVASHAEYMTQYTSYLNRYDSGLVIYWFGFVEDITTNNRDPRLLVLDDFPREDVHLMIIPQQVKRRSSNELDPKAEARFAHRLGGGDGEQFDTPITTPMGTPWR